MRTTVLTMAMGFASACATPGVLRQAVRPTGSLGPYYPPSPSGLPLYPATPWTEPPSTDLTARGGTRAAGPLLPVRVLVVDRNHAPVKSATVELWNVDRNARYICEAGVPAGDPGFSGFGRALTDDAGMAEFLTVWPVGYSRYVFLRRPPHVHLRVQAEGRDDAYEVEVPAATPDGAPDVHLELELLP
jgi:hypothetical protein